MQPDQDSLFQAFHEDHALLGNGFNELSERLRAGDLAGAVQAARVLDATAGAHIAFEEGDFYPALVPLLGRAEVDRMLGEHRDGLDAVRTLLAAKPGAPLDAALRRRLLAQSEAMQVHIAECGELFEAMGRIPPEEQATLRERLFEWRGRRPRWTDLAGRAAPP